jgi:Zn-dependent protease
MYIDSQPNASQFDLRVSIFGIPVTVAPLFWFCGLLLGWDPQSPIRTLLFLPILFISVLVHELGHALFMRWFGQRPVIVLHQFGGFAAYDEIRRMTPFKRLIVTAAGPAAGFLLWGLSYGILKGSIEHYGPDAVLDVLRNTLPEDALLFIVVSLIRYNLLISIFNCIPIHPLDGGQFIRHLLEIFRVQKTSALRVTRIISVIAGTIAAAFLYQINYMFGALIIGILAVANLQHLVEKSDQY